MWRYPSQIFDASPPDNLRFSARQRTFERGPDCYETINCPVGHWGETKSTSTSESQRVFQYPAGGLIETGGQKLHHSLTNCCTATLGAVRCQIQLKWRRWNSNEICCHRPETRLVGLKFSKIVLGGTAASHTRSGVGGGDFFDREEVFEELFWGEQQPLTPVGWEAVDFRSRNRDTNEALTER